jgi:site-specific DNA-methyltransferase (adenine-specific)
MEINRGFEFRRIVNAVSNFTISQGKDYCVLNEDSLKVLKQIPDHSIGLILTDPPYHTTKKKTIVNDTAFKEDKEFIDWISEYAIEWKRILRPNGSLFMFCSSEMSARLECLLSNSFNILSNIVWTKPNEPGFDGWKQKMKKEALRQWYAHTERIIFAEPAFNGNLGRSYFANFLKQQRKIAGISTHDIAEIAGFYGKVNHGGTVSNWEAGRNIPSKAQYQKLVEILLSSGKIKSMPEYENIIRPFNVDSTVEFTDVWNFPSVRPYKGKHPAEKPLDMLKHAIKSTTYEGDIVLDCFAGSGSTGLAALLQNRRTILIEIDHAWTKAIEKKIERIKGRNLPDNAMNKDFLIVFEQQQTLFQNVI